MSVRLTALFTAAPGRERRLREVLEEDARAARGDEGAERFELFVGAEDAGRLALVEQWRSQADLDAHRTHGHRLRAHAALGGEGIVAALEIWRCEPRDGAERAPDDRRGGPA